MLRDYSKAGQDPVFSEVVELDLSTVVSCVSGPKRPQDRAPVTQVKSLFLKSLTNKVSPKLSTSLNSSRVTSFYSHLCI